MKLGDLRRKAQRGTLEVEDLLRAAKARIPGLAEELRSLGRQHKWSASGLLPDATRVVPLARWADTASAYAEGGIPALEALVRDKEYLPFVIALLEELRSQEALVALLSLCAEIVKTPSAEPELAWRLATAFNTMLSLKERAPATNEQAAAVRSFLHRLYPLAPDQAKRALVLLALRGVGDEASLALAKSAADFEHPWEGVKATVSAAITKRMRSMVANTALKRAGDKPPAA